MTPVLIFVLQTVLSLIVFGVIGWWYIWPRLRVQARRDALMPLLFVHALRHVGLTLLATLAFATGVPADFAAQLGYGDLTAGLLALLAIIALRMRWSFALVIVWVMNIWGLIDLVNVGIQGVRLNVTGANLGVTWIIATMFVPVLYVTHSLMIAVLLHHSRAD